MIPMKRALLLGERSTGLTGASAAELPVVPAEPEYDVSKARSLHDLNIVDYNVIKMRH